MQDYVNSMKYKSIMNYNGSAKPIACVDSLTEDNPLISNENVHTFLENDIRNLKRETWSKLDKATKLQKLRVYMAKEVEDSNTTQMEADLLYGYFRSCLEKKKTLRGGRWSRRRRRRRRRRRLRRERVVKVKVYPILPTNNGGETAPKSI